MINIIVTLYYIILHYEKKKSSPYNQQGAHQTLPMPDWSVWVQTYSAYK